MNQNHTQSKKEKITSNYIPLAIYREIAAHLRQIKGVEVNFIDQTSPNFDYTYSQLSGLEISYPNDLNEYEKKFLDSILNYYSKNWSSFQRETI